MSIELQTCPSDIRFPNTNQAQHCWYVTIIIHPFRFKQYHSMTGINLYKINKKTSFFFFFLFLFFGQTNHNHFFFIVIFRTRFNEFLVCQNRNGDEACKRQLQMYRSVCPNEDVENWTEQIEAGTFPGVTFNTAEEDHH